MLVKVHKSYRDVVAVCDSELLGKKFEEDIFQLDVKESFFGGEKHSSNEVEKIIIDLSKEDATFNIVGERAVQLAINAGVISEEGVKKIQGIPFAMVLM